MLNINEIGELIRELRKRKGMTQVELAERSLTTQKSISRIETGKDNASFITVLSIFAALGEEIALKEEGVSLTNIYKENNNEKEHD